MKNVPESVPDFCGNLSHKNVICPRKNPRMTQEKYGMYVHITYIVKLKYKNYVYLYVSPVGAKLKKKPFQIFIFFLVNFLTGQTDRRTS